MSTGAGATRGCAAIPERVRALADAVAREARRRLGPRARVVWFGSWVRGDARPGSDIDLAVGSPEGVDPDAYAALSGFAEELPTLYTIDLVNLDEAGESLRSEIERTRREL